MDIQFYGANCLTVTTKSVRAVIDDNLKDLGLKNVAKPGDVLLFTGPHAAEVTTDPKLVVDHPGEYEVADLSIIGIAVRSHLDESDKRTSTVYKIEVGDVSLLVLGHLYPELSDKELESIGTVDILVVPVGGNGYTLDSVGALTLIKEIEPKIIIPTHYSNKALKYEVPQQTLEEALKGLAMEPSETVAKLKIKSTDITDTSRLIVLEQS